MKNEIHGSFCHSRDPYVEPQEPPKCDCKLSMKNERQEVPMFSDYFKELKKDRLNLNDDLADYAATKNMLNSHAQQISALEERVALLENPCGDKHKNVTGEFYCGKCGGTNL